MEKTMVAKAIRDLSPFLDFKFAQKLGPRQSNSVALVKAMFVCFCFVFFFVLFFLDKPKFPQNLYPAIFENYGD